MERAILGCGLAILVCLSCCGCLSPPAGATVRPEGLALATPKAHFVQVAEDDFSESHPMDCFGWLPFESSWPKKLAKRVGADTATGLYVGDIEVYSDLHIIYVYVWIWASPEYHVSYKVFKKQ